MTGTNATGIDWHPVAAVVEFRSRRHGAHRRAGVIEHRHHPVHRHRGEYPPLGRGGRTDVGRARTTRRARPGCGRAASRGRRENDRRRNARRLRRSARCAARHAHAATITRRPSGDQRDCAAGALRRAYGRRRATQQRQLRHHGQSCRADHERGPRGPGAAFAGGGRRHRRAARTSGCIARSRPGPSAGPGDARACLSGPASAAATGFSVAALA